MNPTCRLEAKNIKFEENSCKDVLVVVFMY